MDSLFLKRYESLIGQINEALDAYLDAIPSPLNEVCRYGVEGGGKRLRPVLFLSVLKAYKKEITADDLKYAAAIECIHAYSLIHDDLPEMDNDDYRRGKPSCHKKFGHSLALLAGDALLNYAFELMSEVAQKGEKYVKAMALTSKCSGARGMIAGQALEFDSSYVDAGENELKKINELKTARLIEASVCSAAIIAGREDHLELWKDFSVNFGQAFQLKDDLLDASSDGKSLLLFMSIAGAEQLLNSKIEILESILRGTGSKSEFIMELCKRMLKRNNETI